MKLPDSRRRICACLAVALTLSFGRSPGRAAENPSAGRVVRPYAIIHAVTNLRRSVAFYRDGLGLQVETASPLPLGSGPAVGQLVGAPGAGAKGVTLDIPGTEFRLILLRFSGVRQKTFHPQVPDFGAVKFIVTVRDMDEAWARIRPHVLRVFTTGGRPVEPLATNHHKAVIVADPDGYLLELQTSEPFAKKSAAPLGSNTIDGRPSWSVEDLTTSLDFCRLGLGFRVVGKRPAAPPSALLLEGTPHALEASGSIRPPGGGTIWFLTDFRNVRRQGLNSGVQDIGGGAVALLTTGLPSLLDALKRQGATVQTSGGAPVNMGHGQEAVFIRSPAGVPMELIEQGH